ncbi:hypothetical protein A2U01_0003641, partial [Trifolium medium]|nr:hypothetical protein [Trifolium medium]
AWTIGSNFSVGASYSTSRNQCARISEFHFARQNDDGIRDWSNELRVEPRRRSGRPTSRWLKEEGSSSGVFDGRRNPGTEFSAGRNTVDPTRPSSQSMHSNTNPQNAITVTSVSANRNEIIPEINVLAARPAGTNDCSQLELPGVERPECNS